MLERELTAPRVVQCEAWPISMHMHWHSTQDSLQDMQYAPRVLFINPRRACAARVTVVGCVCVCVSVKSHLTYGVSVCPENAVTYSFHK